MKKQEVGSLRKGEKAMDLACGSQLENDDKLLKPKQDLRWRMEEESNFDMMHGVMIYFSNNSFLLYSL